MKDPDWHLIVFAILLVVMAAILCGRATILEIAAIQQDGAIKAGDYLQFAGNIVGGFLAAAAACFVVWWEQQNRRKDIERERRELSTAAFEPLVRFRCATWIDVIEEELDDFDSASPWHFVDGINFGFANSPLSPSKLQEEVFRKLYAQSAAFAELVEVHEKVRAAIKQYGTSGLGNFYRTMPANNDERAAVETLLFWCSSLSNTVATFATLLEWYDDRKALADRARAVGRRAWALMHAENLKRRSPLVPRSV